MTISLEVALWCFLIMAGQVPGNAPNPDDATARSAARMEHMKQAANSYEITVASDSTKRLVLTKEPLLRFDDQVIGVVDGTLFVWMLEDRPAAAASIWIRDSVQEIHEFQSLVPDALIGSNHGQPKWTPAQQGFEKQLASNIQPPASSATGRLIQMRALAREYSATVVSSETDQQVLRLLPQPVFRYGRPDGAVIDGALFAFCVGTNPEILLLVEAVENNNELKWNYAFARMTARECKVRRASQVVWTAQGQRGNSPTDPYFSVFNGYNGPGAKGESTPGKE